MINLLNTKEQKGTKAITHEVKLNAKKIFISNTVAGPLLFCWGILLGSVPLSPQSVLRCLAGLDKNTTTYVLVHTVRLPRAVGACIAGMGLSTAGVILQSVMNNSLASPNTIGVNSGAGFAVMLSLLFGGSRTFGIPIAAFVGSLAATLTIYSLAYMADSSRTTIILAGVTVSSFLNAGINTIKLLDSDITINLTSFMMGSLSGLTLNKLAIPSIAILLALIVVLFFTKQ